MRPLAGAALALFLCVACSQKTPEEKLVKSIDSAAGWVPALQMTAEKWVANNVPARFAASAAKAAQKEFEKAQKEAAKSTAARTLRDRIAGDIAGANRFAEALQRAAENGDPRAIAPDIKSLPAIKADFDAIQKQYEGGS